MAKVVVVYHSGYGHTAKQAEAVAKGAGAALYAIDQEGNLPEAAWQALDAADAIVMGSPTYMGSASWQFKKFADETSKRWFAQVWRNKVFGGFTNSGSMNGDKFNTLQYLFTLAMQHSGVWVGTGMLPANTKSAKRDDVNYLGAFGGAMMQSPVDSSPDEVVAGDMETARLYGERIAKVTDHIRLSKEY